MQKQYGSVKKFRAALAQAGFNVVGLRSTIFNDRHKDSGYRRMKLWFADSVQDAPQAKQKKLVEKLKQQFGDQFLMVYLTKRGGWMGGGWSLCVRIRT
jgi:predicted secreted acid phosphatase